MILILLVGGSCGLCGRSFVFEWLLVNNNGGWVMNCWVDIKLVLWILDGCLCGWVDVWVFNLWGDDENVVDYV